MAAPQKRTSQEDRNTWTEEMLRGICAKYKIPDLAAIVDCKDQLRLARARMRGLCFAWHLVRFDLALPRRTCSRHDSVADDMPMFVVTKWQRPVCMGTGVVRGTGFGMVLRRR